MTSHRKGDTAVNQYNSLRKQNNGSTTAAISLALCVVLTATMLFSRLMGFAPADTRHYIPLTKSGGITTVREGVRQDDGSITFRHAGYHPNNHRLLTAPPLDDKFTVAKKNGKLVWEGMTDLEIFKVSYENGAQQVTVHNDNGEKLIAPGTDNTYRIGVENMSSGSVKYSISFEAVCEIIEKGAPTGTGVRYDIPIYGSVSYTKGSGTTATEEYLFGTAQTNEKITKMEKVTHSGSVGKGKYVPYTLYWEWPFEEDDILDTMLGNQAADLDPENKEIRLTIIIKTVAEQSTDPNDDSGLPKTGDTAHVELYAVLMVASLGGLLVILLPRRKEEANEAP